MLAEFVILVASAVAAVIDAYTGEIPEWLTVPLIVIGLAYAAVSGSGWTAVAVSATTMAVGYILYYTGELGGGDVLLLTGISAWKPFIVVLGVSIPSALAILVLGLLLSSIFYSVFYALQLGRIDRRYVALVVPYLFLPALLALLYGSVLVAYLGQRKREELFVREKDVSELVPEDVLAEPVDVLPPGKKVLEAGDIDKLRKSGLKSVKVLDNLPRFGPFVLLALLVLLALESGALDPNSYILPFLS